MVSFAGGWLALFPRIAAEERARRQAYIIDELAHFGSRYPGPTLWVYASRDANTPTEEAVIARHDAYMRAGGHAELLFIRENHLPNGHHVVQQPELWEPQLVEFLGNLL